MLRGLAGNAMVQSDYIGSAQAAIAWEVAAKGLLDVEALQGLLARPFTLVGHALTSTLVVEYRTQLSLEVCRVCRSFSLRIKRRRKHIAESDNHEEEMGQLPRSAR